MKKILLLSLLLGLGFSVTFAQKLYISNMGTGQSYNPKLGAANTPKVVFDDINIPNELIQGADSVKITKLKLGIVRSAGGAAFSAKVYAALINTEATSNKDLLILPPVLLGTVNFDVSPTAIRDVINLGDSINSLFSFKVDPDNFFEGYQTIAIGVSFSNNTGSWEVSAGPDPGDDGMFVYDADNSSSPIAYTWFGGNPPANFRVEVYGKSFTTVPVVLSNFDVQNKNNQNLLSWSTAQESNSSHFSIERSSDGTNFTEIAKVNATGNSANARLYSYTDVTPLNGINYYRLNMVDLDNTSKYSEIKSVKNSVSSFALSVYPNPVSSLMKISLTAEKAELSSITITNIAGQVVYTSQVKIEKGSNMIPVNVSNFASGNYVLKIQLSDNNFVEKFTKE